MSKEQEAATSETATETANSETAEQTSSENQTGLSTEAIAELQARIDAQTAELEKYRKKAEQQEGRAKKAESLLKADKSETSEQIDTLSQQLEIARQQQEELVGQVAKLQQTQVGTTVNNAVLTIASNLAEGAAADLASLMASRMGVRDGQAVVLTDQGTPRIGASGKQMTAGELRDELLKTRPYFLKSRVASGTGGGSDTGGNSGVIKTIDEINAMAPEEAVAYFATLSPEQKKVLRGRA